MIAAIRDGIYAKALTVPGIDENILFWGHAPQAIQGNYIVINGLPSVPNRDTLKQYEEVTYTFDIYGPEIEPIESLKLAIYDVFNNQEFDVVDWATIKNLKIDANETFEADLVHHINIIYQAEFEFTGPALQLISNPGFPFWLAPPGPPGNLPIGWTEFNSGVPITHEVTDPPLWWIWWLQSPWALPDGYIGVETLVSGMRPGFPYDCLISYVPLEHNVEISVSFTDPANPDYQEFIIPNDPRNQDILYERINFRAGINYDRFRIRCDYPDPDWPDSGSGGMILMYALIGEVGLSFPPNPSEAEYPVSIPWSP